MIKQVRIRVQGRVQGVFFRKHAREKAIQCGVKGFVKNLRDGSVLIEAQGSEDQISKMISWCHLGSPGSRVDSIRVEETEPKEAMNGFEIVREDW